MALALMLIAFGLAGLVASAGWWRGRHLESARWVLENVSAPMVAAAPVAAALVLFVGVMLVWPPAVLFTFVAALALMWVLVTTARDGVAGRLPPALRLPATPDRGRGRSRGNGLPPPGRAVPGPRGPQRGLAATHRRNRGA